MKAFAAIAFLLQAFSASCHQSLNFYDVLKVPVSASLAEIDHAFRTLSGKYNSVEAKHDENSLKMFEDIKRAYDVLTDQDKRHVYDYEGIKGLEVFEEQNGGTFQNYDGLPKDKDAVLTLMVSLEEVYNGNLRLVEIRRDATCNHCGGTGVDSHSCDVCKVDKSSSDCQDCQAHGKVCPVCNGKKVAPENDVVSVTIEKGMKDGDEIRLVGESERKPGFAPGDLVFKLQVQENDLFFRQDNDIDVPLHITLKESLLGFKKTVTHLDGRSIVVTGEGVTDPYAVKKVDGEGMPIREAPGQFGDLFVEIIVDYPESLSPAEEEAVDALFKA